MLAFQDFGHPHDSRPLRSPVAHPILVADTGLRKIPFAGHPEWLEGSLFAMASKDHGTYNRYDVAAEKWAGLLGGPGIFPDTEDDNALSPDTTLFVGSYKQKPTECVYTIFRRSDGTYVCSPPVPTKAGGGVVCIDSAPRWNRTSDGLLVPGVAQDGTLQLYVLRLTK